MLLRIIFVTWCLFFKLKVSNGTCYQTELVVKWVQQKYTKTFIQTYTDKCWFGRRCEKTKIGSYPDTRYVPKHAVEKRCCSGYIMADVNNSSSSIQCKPVCLPSCKNGDCIQPGVCQCKPGYLVEAGTQHSCLPSCVECTHGTCIAPNICNCSFGYTFLNGTCQAICTEPCLNGACVAPDTCQCLYGFRKSESNICTPYCSRGCLHGTCIAPETCTCDKGWISGHADECVPACERSCGNGTCTAPNVCECTFGYKVDDDSTPICVPICDTECGNGTCIGPNVCECLPGYKPDINNSSRCVPHCDIDCGNGSCAGPNICECKEGFKVDNSKASTCVPDCDNCEGVCVGPGECECEEPFKAKRLTADGKQCVDNDKLKCYRTVCIIDATESTKEKNVSYGYDDILINDTIPLKSSSKAVPDKEANISDYYDFNNDNIYNDSTYQSGPVEINVATRSERWVQSKWAYAVLTVGVVILAIILGSVVIYWKALTKCGSGSYVVEEEGNKDVQEHQGNEMRMSSLLKTRQANPS